MRLGQQSVEQLAFNLREVLVHLVLGEHVRADLFLVLIGFGVRLCIYYFGHVLNFAVRSSFVD